MYVTSQNFIDYNENVCFEAFFGFSDKFKESYSNGFQARL